MRFQSYLKTIKAGKNLSRKDAEAFLAIMLDSEALSDDQIVDALTALTKKNPVAEEVSGFVDAMRSRMIRVAAPESAIDMCGTGGDRSNSFNISTAASILTAAGGVTVAKHGNRAATSLCGSADVLVALNIPIDLGAEAANMSLQNNHFAFLFAPYYHPSLKRLSMIRKQLGFPTVFNLLGPLLNPAGVKRQVIGTYNSANSELLAEVIAGMQFVHAIVLTSEDGLDEAGLSAPVRLIEIKGKQVKRYVIKASDYGLTAAPMSALAGGDAAMNAQIITSALTPSKTLSAAQRTIVFNSGLGFYISGKTSTIAEGIEMAKHVLVEGQANQLLKKLQSA